MAAVDIILHISANNSNYARVLDLYQAPFLLYLPYLLQSYFFYLHSFLLFLSPRGLFYRFILSPTLVSIFLKHSSISSPLH